MWSHNGAAHSDPFDRRLDQPFGLRVLNELARVCHSEIPSLRHRHSVRIDAGPTVENPRTRQLIRHLEQAWLMLKITSALPDFSISNVPARLDARTTTAFFSVRETKISGWDFSCTATRIPGRSTSGIAEMEEPPGVR